MGVFDGGICKIVPRPFLNFSLPSSLTFEIILFLRHQNAKVIKSVYLINSFLVKIFFDNSERNSMLFF